MSRSLDDLSADLKPRAFELLARLVESGIAVMVVDTLRTQADHDQNLANGTSATKFSRHLPRKLRCELPPDHPDAEKSDAMDLCPYETYALHGPDKLKWDTTDPAWKVIRDLAEGLGLVSGARWIKPHDPGHVELPRAVWDAL